MNTLYAKPTETSLQMARDILSRGGLVIFPTETVYGLGGNALNGESSKKIYAAKGRPSDNPLIIHIANPEDAEKYAYTNDNFQKLANAFWPGPLTIILPKKDIVPKETTGGLDTVAIRCPVDETAHRLIELCGFPIAAPSANLSGSPSPTCPAHVKADMDGRVDMILEGGECDIGLESTIVLCQPDKLVLLRPGAVTFDALCMVCANVEIAPAVTAQLGENEKALSPGMKYKHYAPTAPVVLLTGKEEDVLHFLQNKQKECNCAVLCYDEEISQLENKNLYPVGAKDDLPRQAHTLFHHLREADVPGISVIYAHLPPLDGMGLALYNRLIRASAHTILPV